MCEHNWIETTGYWHLNTSRMIATSSGKTFARCLECDEKMPNIEWYEFPHSSVTSAKEEN